MGILAYTAIGMIALTLKIKASCLLRAKCMKNAALIVILLLVAKL
jgi:hypothetical protein